MRARLLDEDPDRVAQLHQRASDWCHSHHQTSEAIRHALAGGEVERAAQIIEKFCADKGLPYHHTGWGRALWDTTMRMRELPGYTPEERPPRLAIDL